MGAKHANCAALEEVATGLICKQLGMEVMTLEEWDELQKKKKHRKKEKKDGIETISDIEDGEDGNICEYGLAQLMADCGETLHCRAPFVFLSADLLACAVQLCSVASMLLTKYPTK
jgi:hypothetical protein